MKFKIQNLTHLIGIFLLGYILYKIDLKVLFSILKSTNLPILLIGTVFSLSAILVMNIRWGRIIQALKVKIHYKDRLIILAKGIALGTVTPGKLGELYRAKYLMNITKKSAGICFSTVILDRIFDIITLLLLGLVCTAILIHLYLVQIPFWIILLFALGVILAILFFLSEKKARLVLRPLFNLFIPEKQKRKLRFHFKEFYRGIRSMDSGTLFSGFLYTLLIWFMNFVATYFISSSLGLPVPFWFIILMLPIITLINLIPISVSGFGTIQVSCIFLLGLIGVSSESAVALSFLLIFVTIWIYALPGAIFYMIKK